ncbi:MAG: hypothetical protein WD065_13565 [Planctomycetaceae bacterium]
MYRIYERPLSGTEREQLKRCLAIDALPPTWSFYQNPYVTDFITFAISVTLAAWWLDVPFYFAACVGLMLYCFFAYLRYKAIRLLDVKPAQSRRLSRAKFLTAVASADKVRVHHIQSDAVVEVWSDAGTLYLFDVGDGHTYWIDEGFELMKGTQKLWPSCEFEVVELDGHGYQFGPFVLGEPLEPREGYYFGDLFDHTEYELPSEGLIPQSLDELLSSLKAERERASTTNEMT